MAPAKDNTLHFACPQCQAKLKIPRTLAGSHQRCPHCQMKIQVPWRTQIAPGETYPLQQDAGPSPADRSESFPVICGVCHTRMDATKDQIGQEIVCPDCGTRTLVRQPAEASKKREPRSAEEIGDYPLAGDVDHTAGGIAAENFVAVLCPVCHTRMLATLDQVGGKLTCPDCGSAAVVPPPPPPRPKIDVMEGAGEGYALVERDGGSAKTELPVPAFSPADGEPSATEAYEPPVKVHR
jgi:DNA-directed RNA polymerase subunit RPC12/RpoP